MLYGLLTSCAISSVWTAPVASVQQRRKDRGRRGAAAVTGRRGRVSKGRVGGAQSLALRTDGHPNKGKTGRPKTPARARAITPRARTPRATATRGEATRCPIDQVLWRKWVTSCRRTRLLLLGEDGMVMRSGCRWPYSVRRPSRGRGGSWERIYSPSSLRLRRR